MIPDNFQKIVHRVIVNRLGGRARSQSGPARRWQQATDINQGEPGDQSSTEATKSAADGTAKTAEQKREHLRLLLDRCTAKLNSYKVEPQNLSPGDPCNVVKGKFYGARGIVMDVDFIKNRVLIELKSYRDPVWMGFNEING